jgi:hypothetical protein
LSIIYGLNCLFFFENLIALRCSWLVCLRALWGFGDSVRVRTGELVSHFAYAPESWTRAGHLFREKHSENTREFLLWFSQLLYRAPFCIFFIETDPTRHIVPSLVLDSPCFGYWIGVTDVFSAARATVAYYRGRQ